MQDDNVLINILISLDEIKSNLDRLEKRVVNIEQSTNCVIEKTNDIHQFVPFVGWLSHIATLLPSRFLIGTKPVPILKDDNN